MNEWKCTVKTPSNWLQTVRVEAYTHSDAVAFAESMTGGKCIMAVIDNSYSSDDNESDSGSSSGFDGGFVLLALVAFILIAAWKYVLLFAILGLGIWFLLNISKD
jgi:hypothetical protein